MVAAAHLSNEKHLASPLLTNIQASLVHLGPSAVMGTSCLVNKQACKHKMYCVLHTVLFTGLLESEIIRTGYNNRRFQTWSHWADVGFSKGFTQITVIEVITDQ